MKRIIGLLGVFILFTCCATAYEKTGFKGGYSEKRLSENVFQVSFRGNGFTSKERVLDYSLLRSAEIALLKEFKYFIIVESGNSAKYSASTTPRTTQTNGSGTLGGNTISGSATTFSTGGNIYLISKPRATNIIVCFKDKPDFNGIIYDADIVYKSIRNKYSTLER